MKIVRSAYVKTREVYEMEITEQLAQEVEDAIRRELVDPVTMPHISVQTLIQCWECNGPDSVKDYKVDVRDMPVQFTKKALLIKYASI